MRRPRGVRGGRRRRGRGFTLVELMLAVLILSIMMVIVYGVVMSTVTAARRVEEVTASSEIGPAILTQIRSDLEGAFLPKDPKDPKYTEYFVGTRRSEPGGGRDRIDFISSKMAYGSEREGLEPRFHSVNEVGYQVIDSRTVNGICTLYRRQVHFMTDDPLKGGKLTELYDRVSSFRLRYLDKDKEAWHDDWNSKTLKGLPRAVEIELKIVVTDHDQPVEQTLKTTVTFVR